MVTDLKLCFLDSLFHFFSSLTILISTLFLTFSMVFPNTELFMSLKKSFSKSVVPLVRRSVLSCMYFLIQSLSRNLTPRCILVSFNPRLRYCFRFVWWRTYFSLLLRLGMSFSVLLTVIFLVLGGIRCVGRVVRPDIPGPLRGCNCVPSIFPTRCHPSIRSP